MKASTKTIERKHCQTCDVVTCLAFVGCQDCYVVMCVYCIVHHPCKFNKKEKDSRWAQFMQEKEQDSPPQSSSIMRIFEDELNQFPSDDEQMN